MANEIKAVVTTQSGINETRARVTPQNKLLVTNYQINATAIKLGDLFNVDASTQEDGALLVYNETTENWEATRFLNNINTIINGGNF
jgi:hypothetical protein